LNELTLCKLLLNREAYNKYFAAVDIPDLRENHREVWYLYQCLQDLHQSFPDHEQFNLDELQTYFWAKYPDASKDIYSGLFDQLGRTQIDEAVGQQILATIARRKALISLSETAYKASQGLATVEEVHSLLDSVEKAPVVAVEEDTFLTTNIENLVAETVAKPGIRWRLDCLNKSLGSIRPGDFGFVFARPETGKTTFIADTVANALAQVSGPVLWFNNEEQDSKVMLRVVQSYFGIKLDALMANVVRFNKLFNEQVGGRFRLVNSSRTDINKSNVERIIEAVRPSLIIYDQIDKIKGFKADRDDLLLGAIYQWARELAKQYAPTIAVCQADGTGEGQKWLTMANVANAKTSKQAEADFIIGIGKTHDQDAEYIRYINISKNKLMGDKDSEPALRHGRFEVLIQPEIARYKDVIAYS